MAQLRLIGPQLAVSLVLASCGRSEAAPPAGTVRSGLAAPAGWHVDGGLAKLAATAASDPKSGPRSGIAVAGSEAWSEPSRGCYAVWLALHGASAPIDVAAEQLLAALAKELPDVKLAEVAKPTGGDEGRGTLALSFDARGFHGKIRAELAGTGDIHALACVWNQREPRACAKGCAALFGAAT